MEITSGFLLGLGSNIDPKDNFAKIIQQLLSHFDTLHLSRVLKIPPVGMNSHRDFLNAVAFIETQMEQATLKAVCNQIEIRLGRNRSDPDSKLKDRTADIDILAYFGRPEDWQRNASSFTDEYYLYPLINELCSFLTGDKKDAIIQKGTPLNTYSLSFGETATTIYRD